MTSKNLLVNFGLKWGFLLDEKLPYIHATSNTVQPCKEVPTSEQTNYSNPQVNFQSYQMPNYASYPQYTYGQQQNFLEQSYLDQQQHQQSVRFPGLQFKKPNLVEPIDSSVLSDAPCSVQW